MIPLMAANGPVVGSRTAESHVPSEEASRRTRSPVSPKRYWASRAPGACCQTFLMLKFWLAPFCVSMLKEGRYGSCEPGA